MILAWASPFKLLAKPLERAHPLKNEKMTGEA